MGQWGLTTLWYQDEQYGVLVKWECSGVVPDGMRYRRQMLSNRITPTTLFYGNSYSISTLCIYCRIDGALIIPRRYTYLTLAVVMDPKRPEENRSGLCQGSAPTSVACLAIRQFYILKLVGRIQGSYIFVTGRVARGDLSLLPFLSI